MVGTEKPLETGRRPGPGVSRTQATEENKNRLRDLLLEDDEWTSEELATYLNVSQSTVLRMLNELGAKKLLHGGYHTNLILATCKRVLIFAKKTLTCIVLLRICWIELLQ